MNLVDNCQHTYVRRKHCFDTLFSFGDADENWKVFTEVNRTLRLDMNLDPPKHEKDNVYIP
jgi:hypothetical protein